MAVAAPESSRQVPSAEAAQKIEEAIERITDLYLPFPPKTLNQFLT
jgi:hypothetical protein